MADFYNETLGYIRKQYSGTPEIGMVLGTGLGGLVEIIDIEKQLAYNFIPHFPISTVESHFGKLIFGNLAGKSIVAMQGRMHYYEGYSMQQITYPIRILKLLGIKTLLLSNAAGALNPGYRKGDMMAIDDHINLLPENPLRGPNQEDFGPRFPDMSRPYDPQLIKAALNIAQDEGYRLHRGVYCAVQGPNLETRAEYRYLRTIGADVVGMSTIPEVIVARHMGLRTFAVSILTDECDPDHLQPVALADILEAAKTIEPKLTRLMYRLVQEQL